MMRGAPIDCQSCPTHQKTSIDDDEDAAARSAGLTHQRLQSGIGQIGRCHTHSISMADCSADSTIVLHSTMHTDHHSSKAGDAGFDQMHLPTMNRPHYAYRMEMHVVGVQDFVMVFLASLLDVLIEYGGG
mmetsp:Transcript_20012/g.31782  ORF Transcript_20012/g.31782 Transcript_20012/m.31782 type:complete len:130 (+) Transcript_20012:236-625(+)